MSRILKPSTDEELAAAERVQRLRQVRADIDSEIEGNVEIMANAGEPEAQTAKQRREAASESLDVVSTLASMSNRPAEEGALTQAEAMTALREAQRKKREAHRPPAAAEPTPQPKPRAVRPARPRPAPAEPALPESPQDRADRIMQLNWLEWSKTVKSNRKKANDKLALDMGRDAVLFLRAGLFSDMISLVATIQRLQTPIKGGGDDTADKGLASEIEQMKRELRGQELPYEPEPTSIEAGDEGGDDEGGDAD